MAYKRKYTRRRKPRYASSWRRKAATYGAHAYGAYQTAKLAMQGVDYLKGLVNAEKHKHSIEVNDETVDVTDPYSLTLTSMAVGDTDVTRTGNSVLGRGLLLRSHFRLGASSESANVRIVIARDKQQVSDSMPTFSSAFTATTNPLIAPLRTDNVGRFQIVRDFTINLDVARLREKLVKLWIPIKQHIRWNGNTNADMQKNHYYLWMVTEAPAGAGEPVIFDLFTRFYYYDN